MGKYRTQRTSVRAETTGCCEQTGWGPLQSYRRNGLVGRTPASKKNYIFLLLFPFLDPKMLHGFYGARLFCPVPETTCVPSCHPILAVQGKRWESFMSGPAFAMDKMAGPILFRMKFSSSNFSPEVDLWPVPSRYVKSPRWHTNPGTIL